MPFSGLSRRELLAAFLGAPLAMTVGCGKPSLPPKGEIVGGSHALGHRIRDGWRPRPDEKDWREVSVVIVGGGAAGLSAAWRLRRLGIDDFVILELEATAGGTSISGTGAAVAFPWGAHYLPVPQKNNAPLIALLDELRFLEGRDDDGEPIAAEQFLWRDPEERLFSGGLWHEGLFPVDRSSDEDLAQLSKFRKEIDHWVAWRDADGHRAFTIPSRQCSGDQSLAALDQISFAEWLDARGLTSPRLRWLADYACRDDFGMLARQTSAWAGVFYFASRMKTPGDSTQPLLTWPEGNARLTNDLAAAAGDRLKVRHPVTEIVSEFDGTAHTARVVAVDVSDPSGERVVGYRAPLVIFAAPQFLAEHLIEGYRAERPDHGQFEYGSWMVANLHLSERPVNRGFPVCWDNVIEESPSLGYVVATHQLGIDRGPTVLTYYYPLCDDDPAIARRRLLQLDWSEWAEICLTDLERAHPDIRPLVQRLDVMRWGHAMIRPRPGFLWSEARHRASETFRGIHFANTDLSGMALFEEAFDHGVRAANEAAASLKSKSAG